MSNLLCKLLGIRYPIIQAGMVWVSGGKLAAACANSGICGIIGAGSMDPALLTQHIKKAKSLSGGVIGVNIPLLYTKTPEQIEAALEQGIRVFITSAGSPKTYTSKLKQAGCTVGHVVSAPSLAQKCEDAGVDFVVAEGFEAGGHNGRAELTTMVLIPQVRDKIKIPLVAAGGIGDGRAMAAAMALGADGVQMGTRFVACEESSAHANFKNLVMNASEDATMLSLKKLVPVRLLKNPFWEKIHTLEESGASSEKLAEVLGKGRAKLGMLEGDSSEGELEIGQICSLIRDCPSARVIVERTMQEFAAAREKIRFEG